METLPFEMKEQILSQLSYKDFVRLCSTNKEFKDICSQPGFILRFIKKDFGKQLEETFGLSDFDEKTLREKLSDPYVFYLDTEYPKKSLHDIYKILYYFFSLLDIYNKWKSSGLLYTIYKRPEYPDFIKGLERLKSVVGIEKLPDMLIEHIHVFEENEDFYGAFGDVSGSDKWIFDPISKIILEIKSEMHQPLYFDNMEKSDLEEILYKLIISGDVKTIEYLAPFANVLPFPSFSFEKEDIQKLVKLPKEKLKKLVFLYDKYNIKGKDVIEKALAQVNVRRRYNKK